MIKNLKIKLLLTNTVFKALSALNAIVPKDDKIVLLYSNMGFRDNIAYLYDYMIREEYNKKYKIYRSQNELFYGAELPYNVHIISNVKGVLLFLFAGHIFYAFGKLPIYPSKEQKVIQMWHGSPFKGTDVRQKAEITHDYRKSYYTNVLSTSSVFAEFWSEEFDCGLERISICGHPRTDAIANPYSKIELNIEEDDKLIMWMPTFRQSKKLGYNDIDTTDSLVPVVKYEDFFELNEVLKAYKLKLMIKLHPVQDTDEYKDITFSNIILLSHERFIKSGLDLYRLLGSADGLITDYSSVFYDFMLVNRPIAFTEDDFDEYKDSRGFAVEDPDHYRVGHKIKCKNDLISFLEDVYIGNDIWKAERECVNYEVNEYRDYNNSRRALEIGNVIME